MDTLTGCFCTPFHLFPVISWAVVQHLPVSLSNPVLKKALELYLQLNNIVFILILLIVTNPWTFFQSWFWKYDVHGEWIISTHLLPILLFILRVEQTSIFIERAFRTYSEINAGTFEYSHLEMWSLWRRFMAILLFTYCSGGTINLFLPAFIMDQQWTHFNDYLQAKGFHERIPNGTFWSTIDVVPIFPVMVKTIQLVLLFFRQGEMLAFLIAGCNLAHTLQLIARNHMDPLEEALSDCIQALQQLEIRLILISPYHHRSKIRRRLRYEGMSTSDDDDDDDDTDDDCDDDEEEETSSTE